MSTNSWFHQICITFPFQEWFSHRITEFANDLRKPISNRACSPTNNDLDASVIIKDGTIKVLTNLALEFDDLANTCLLVLHLEVRVQCFHHLRSNEKNPKHKKSANDSLEPDSKVMKLTKVLSDMDEAFNATLHPRKTKVIVGDVIEILGKFDFYGHFRSFFVVFSTFLRDWPIWQLAFW